MRGRPIGTADVVKTLAHADPADAEKIFTLLSITTSKGDKICLYGP